MGKDKVKYFFIFLQAGFCAAGAGLGRPAKNFLPKFP
jgi:hypothetical protein